LQFPKYFVILQKEPIKEKKKMCTYSITLDDSLATELERALNGQSFQTWVQQQVVLFVRDAGGASRRAKVKNHSGGVHTDEELAARFSDKAMPAMPEDASWSTIINANIGKTIKPVEKWL